MASKELAVHGQKPVDLAKENKRLRVENAFMRGKVYYDEMFRETIERQEKEITTLSENLKNANGTAIRLKTENKRLREEVERLKAPTLEILEGSEDDEAPRG